MLSGPGGGRGPQGDGWQGLVGDETAVPVRAVGWETPPIRAGKNRGTGYQLPCPTPLKEQMPDDSTDFRRNLNLLCSRYRSISEVCRRLKINRQQFNKYLGGQSSPSLHTLRRLADFFGVDEAELMMPHEDFARDVFNTSGGDSTPMALRREFRARRAALRDGQEKLKPYVGYYHLHFRSPAWPGALIRTLFVIWQDAEATYAKNVERLVRAGRPRSGAFVQKFEAAVIHEGDRIFIVDRHDKRELGLSLTVVYPSKRSRFDMLHGLMLSVTSSGGNVPYSSRIVLKYLGRDIDRRAALSACGIYREGAEAIDEDIWHSTRNVTAEADSALTAHWT